MPVTYMWDDSDKTVLCYRLQGSWTWENIYETVEESRKLWGDANHIVDIIVDMNDSAGFPPGNILGHLRNISNYYRSPKVGNSAIVGASDFFRMAWELFYKVYIQSRQQQVCQTVLVKDIDAARATLASFRKGATAR